MIGRPSSGTRAESVLGRNCGGGGPVKGKNIFCTKKRENSRKNLLIASAKKNLLPDQGSAVGWRKELPMKRKKKG